MALATPEQVISGQHRIIYDQEATSLIARMDQLLHPGEGKDPVITEVHDLLHQLSEHLVENELAFAGASS